MDVKIVLVTLSLLCTFVNAEEFAGQDLLKRIEALEERARKQQDEFEKQQTVLETQQVELKTQQAELKTLRQQNQAMESEMNELKDLDVLQTRRIEVLEKQERAMKETIEMLMNDVHQTTTDNNNNNNSSSNTGSQTSNKPTSGNQSQHDIKESPTKSYAGHNRIRQVEQGSTVAFFATRTAHAQHLGQNQPVAFDNAITNIGHAYHTSTGAFTAPVSGVYEFSTTILSSSETAHYAYAVNGKALSYMLSYSSEAYETSSMTAILDLTQGDDVTILSLDSDKFVHGGHYSAFSGFLLAVNANGVTSQIIG